MKQELSSVVHNFPYNSFGKIYKAEGVEYPESFGGNCVFLTQKLTSHLIHQGLVPHYVHASDRVHWATLCREGKQLYHLDPFLMHEEPIPVGDIIKTGKERVYDAHPYPSKLTVKPLGQHSFRVTLHALRQENYLPLRHYTYDIRDTTLAPPENTHQQRDESDGVYLTLRVLEENRDVSSIFLYADGNMSTNTIGKRRTSMKKDDGFFNEFERIAGELHTNTTDLLRFFYRGKEIYNERSVRSRTSVTSESSLEHSH